MAGEEFTRDERGILGAVLRAHPKRATLQEIYSELAPQPSWTALDVAIESLTQAGLIDRERVAGATDEGDDGYVYGFGLANQNALGTADRVYGGDYRKLV